MKHRFVIILFLSLFAGYTARSQSAGWDLNIDYNYSFPLGAFRSDLVKDASPRGFTGTFLYHLNPRMAVGFGFGYQDYYQKYPRQLYKVGNSQDLSAVVTNSLQMVPLMAHFDYYPFADGGGRVQPYIGVGAGFQMVNFDQYLGEFSSGNSGVGFRALAGLGARMPVSKNRKWGVDIGGSYDIAPYKKSVARSLDNANVRGGVYFKLE